MDEQQGSNLPAIPASRQAANRPAHGVKARAASELSRRRKLGPVARYLADESKRTKSGCRFISQRV